MYLKEWTSAEESISNKPGCSLSIETSENAENSAIGPQIPADDPPKELIEFEYVVCIGGDGTLLRLLRILFFHFVP